MSTVQGGQGNIVTNGLVLNLDAANPRSYPQPYNGTTWTDLSGNGNDGTLISGSSYSSANGGSIVFDGVDDYVTNVGTTSTFSFIQNTGIFTIDAWVKPNLLGTAMYFLGNNDGTTTSKGFFLGKQATNNFSLSLTSGIGGQSVLGYQISNYYTDTNWVNILITCNGLTAQAYKNGLSFGSVSNTISTLSTGDSTKVLSIGRINNYPISYWNGNIASTRIYNRALSTSEVLQNFNATRARFGI
jgi:hypothetical protein